MLPLYLVVGLLDRGTDRVAQPPMPWVGVLRAPPRHTQAQVWDLVSQRVLMQVQPVGLGEIPLRTNSGPQTLVRVVPVAAHVGLGDQRHLKLVDALHLPLDHRGDLFALVFRDLEQQLIVHLEQ